VLAHIPAFVALVNATGIAVRAVARGPTTTNALGASLAHGTIQPVVTEDTIGHPYTGGTIGNTTGVVLIMITIITDAGRSAVHDHTLAVFRTTDIQASYVLVGQAHPIIRARGQHHYGCYHPGL